MLGGAVSRRQWSNPVTMTEVLRSAIAEVEQYPRVKLVPPIDGTLRGHAVADVIHLLAELVENATVFSAPHTQVLLRAQQVTAGLALEVEDRGLGMPGNEQKRMNALLAAPDQVNVAHLLQDGRIGLFVVASLARRHGIAVRLQSNIYGGTQAVLVLPQSLLGVGGDAPAGGDAAPVPPPGPAHRPPAEDDTAGHRRPNPGLHHGPGTAEGQGPSGTPGPAQAPAPAPAAQTSADRQQPYVPSQPLRLHQPPQQGRHQGEAPPLPLRAERLDRPTPAEALPGVRRTDEAPAMLRTEPGVVRGTMGRPQLPRRANQEHLVPQLREAPAPRTEDEQALHDPGLMAAFRRGIELAEARTESETDTDRSQNIDRSRDTEQSPDTDRGPDTGLESAPRQTRQTRQPRTPPAPLPVRGLTTALAAHHPDRAPDPDAVPVTDPLEANTSKE